MNKYVDIFRDRVDARVARIDSDGGWRPDKICLELVGGPESDFLLCVYKACMRYRDHIRCEWVDEPSGDNLYISDMNERGCVSSNLRATCVSAGSWCYHPEASVMTCAIQDLLTRLRCDGVVDMTAALTIGYDPRLDHIPAVVSSCGLYSVMAPDNDEFSIPQSVQKLVQVIVCAELEPEEDYYGIYDGITVGDNVKLVIDPFDNAWILQRKAGDRYITGDDLIWIFAWNVAWELCLDAINDCDDEPDDYEEDVE